MPTMNMTVVVLGFALVAALFVKFHQSSVVANWLSPFKLRKLVGVLMRLLPYIQQRNIPAFVLGYALVVVLLVNASVLLVLSGLSKWLMTPTYHTYVEQVA
jgi:hypothetical protein